MLTSLGNEHLNGRVAYVTGPYTYGSEVTGRIKVKADGLSVSINLIDLRPKVLPKEQLLRPPPAGLKIVREHIRSLIRRLHFISFGRSEGHKGGAASFAGFHRLVLFRCRLVVIRWRLVLFRSRFVLRASRVTAVAAAEV